eukprot:7306955-Pyramimonas_sp.AAC.1
MSMVDVEIEKEIGFKGSFAVWWDSLSKISQRIASVDIAGEAKADEVLKDKLQAMRKSELNSFVSDRKLTAIVPGSVDMFATQKQKLIDTLMEEVRCNKGPNVA